MTFSNSSLNFDDVTEIMDRAIESERGVKIPCPSPGHAVRMRQRMNTARKRDRENSRHRNAPGDPGYGRSVYDKLEISIPRPGEPEDNCVFLRKQILDDIEIVEL